jgi:hypothetical protein
MMKQLLYITFTVLCCLPFNSFLQNNSTGYINWKENSIILKTYNSDSIISLKSIDTLVYNRDSILVMNNEYYKLSLKDNDFGNDFKFNKLDSIKEKYYFVRRYNPNFSLNLAIFLNSKGMPAHVFISGFPRKMKEIYSLEQELLEGILQTDYDWSLIGANMIVFLLYK